MLSISAIPAGQAHTHAHALVSAMDIILYYCIMRIFILLYPLYVPQLRNTGKRVGGIRLRTVKKRAAFIIIRRDVPAYLYNAYNIIIIIYANKYIICAGAEREQ